ncbi:MAG: hypothetical protein JXQ27_05295 [Acidobacteria bacterium]|nr:hypothetical protein [Acidobacteriota bacterium]
MSSGRLSTFINWIRRLPLWLGLLAVLGQPAPAVTPDRASWLNALQARISAAGYSFSVGYSPALDIPRKQLCGWRPDDEAWQRLPRLDLPRAEELPDRFDWRELGGLTSVKWQQSCGACYAFANLGALESQILIQEGQRVDLAEQLPVDCNPHAQGCTGGPISFYFLIWHGATFEHWYPYQSRETDCLEGDISLPYDVYTSYAVANEVPAIKQAIYDYGPVICGVAADDAFWAYREGIYEGPGAPQRNHVVILAGWDDNDGQGYWILKNSWGHWWGEEGYMRIRYGAAKIGTNCTCPDYRPRPGPKLCQTVADSWLTGYDEQDASRTAALRLVMKNFGTTARQVRVTLRTADPGVILLADEVAYPDLKQGEEGMGDGLFHFALAAGLPDEPVIDFRLDIRTEFGHQMTGRAVVTVVKPPVLILDLDPDHDSAPAIQTELTANQVAWAYTRHPELTTFDDYDTLFVCTGDGATCPLTPAHHEGLNRALRLHTHVYLEGRAVWHLDAGQYPDLAWFHVTPGATAAPPPAELRGCPATYWRDVRIGLQTGQVDVTELRSDASAVTILRGFQPDIACSAACRNHPLAGINWYTRNVSSTIEFGDLQATAVGSAPYDVMRRILKFFRLVDILSGDLDDDGELTSTDLILLAHYLTENVELSPIVEADLNLSGRVDCPDLTWLAVLLVEGDHSS